MGGKRGKKTTVGYKYYFSIQSGIGRGPVNEIVAITADEKTVFAGKAGEITTNTTIRLNKPNLFGGTDVGGEGGIQGIFEVAMGDASQQPSNRVIKLLGNNSIIPAFRGMVTTFFDGMISAYSASPKPWKYRVRRTTQGWSNGEVWYPEKCAILLRDDISKINENDKATEENLRTIHAMNPAHILVECATNKEWGRGLSLSEDLDLNLFKQAADTLYHEGFGLCFRYNRQTGLDMFIQQILDHIGAVQYADLSTGKVCLKLIRSDYKTEDLPLFTYDNGILLVQDDDSSAADNVPNEIVVKWHNPVTNEESEVRAQNLGAIQSVGLISSSNNYKAIPTFDLAARVAQRDLEAGISGLTRLTIQFDRRASGLAPADCFRVSLPDRGIDDMVMRVSGINEHESGMLEITAIQDVFGLGDAVYSRGNQAGTVDYEDSIIKAVDKYALFEAPYFVLQQISDKTIESEAGYIMLASQRPSSLAINYILQTTTSSDFIQRGIGDWTPSASIKGALSKTDKILNVNFHDSLEYITTPCAALINNEIVRVDSLDEVNNTVTIARGCADTLPQQHKNHSTIWFFDRLFDTDAIEYLSDEIVYIQQLTQTTTSVLSSSNAPVRSIRLNSRQARPYPPANLVVNGKMVEAITLSEDGEALLSWSHRNKIIQQDNLVAYDEGKIEKSESVEYRIDFYQKNKLIRTESINDDNYKLIITDDEIVDSLRVYSYDINNELESWQSYLLPIQKSL